MFICFIRSLVLAIEFEITRNFPNSINKYNEEEEEEEKNERERNKKKEEENFKINESLTL